MEIVEACYPLHDVKLNRHMEHEFFWNSWFVTDEQLDWLHRHYGEEIAFFYASAGAKIDPRSSIVPIDASPRRASRTRRPDASRQARHAIEFRAGGSGRRGRMRLDRRVQH